jgi:hypothetical protein
VKSNIGAGDTVFRIVVGQWSLPGCSSLMDAWGGLIGLAPLATGISGWCPIYSLFGISTKGRGASGPDGRTAMRRSHIAIGCFVF